MEMERLLILFKETVETMNRMTQNKTAIKEPADIDICPIKVLKTPAVTPVIFSIYICISIPLEGPPKKYFEVKGNIRPNVFQELE